MKYKTILADPPWSYRQAIGKRNRDGDRSKGGLPYETMTVEAIAALSVEELADDDCMLWLWTTNTHIHDALHVLDAWGFRYLTKATWVKTNIGLGYWLRGQTEDILLGVRGSPRSKFIAPHGAAGHGYSTAIVHSAKGRHSEKPAAAMDMIEELGEGPRLELFARSRRLGWHVWGNHGVDVDVELVTV